jgi:hypothetical protein
VIEQDVALIDGFAFAILPRNPSVGNALASPDADAKLGLLVSTPEREGGSNHKH